MLWSLDVDLGCDSGGKEETGASACTGIMYAIRETDIAARIDLRVVKELEDFMLHARAIGSSLLDEIRCIGHWSNKPYSSTSHIYANKVLVPRLRWEIHSDDVRVMSVIWSWSSGLLRKEGLPKQIMVKHRCMNKRVQIAVWRCSPSGLL